MILKPNINNWKLDLDDIHWIENALNYRLKRLTLRKTQVKKQSSIVEIDKEVKHITDLQGKMFNQKQWYRPKDKVYISG
jgi:hypothetical protein